MWPTPTNQNKIDCCLRVSFFSFALLRLSAGSPAGQLRGHSQLPAAQKTKMLLPPVSASQ